MIKTMELKQARKGIRCPMIQCDWCGKPIIDVTRANAEFNEDGFVLMLHKRCSSSRRVQTGPTTYWQPLHMFICTMLYNSGYKKPDAALQNHYLGIYT